MIAATGGLDVLSEESLNSMINLNTSCCLLHAIQGGLKASVNATAPGLLVMKRVLNRLST